MLHINWTVSVIRETYAINCADYFLYFFSFKQIELVNWLMSQIPNQIDAP